MTPVAALITDVDNSVGRRSGRDRVRTLDRLTDLLVAGAKAFTDEQLALFDEVMQRFAIAIEIGARIDLAERLAGLGRAPSGILSTLAHDEIRVARPILTGSPCLTDQMLLEIAAERGRDHMLAMCERKTLSTTGTDMLVSDGDGDVRRSVASNGGARFSAMGTATLVDHARNDLALGQTLMARTDIPANVRGHLVAMAKALAAKRIEASLPGAGHLVAGAVERSARRVDLQGAATARSYLSGFATIRALVAVRPLTEADLLGFASEKKVEETIAALSVMAELSIPCMERIFDDRGNDLLIVIGRAKGWSWRTVLGLLRLRDPGLTDRASLKRMEETFNGLTHPAATRVVQFLKVRETAAATPAKGVKPS